MTRSGPPTVLVVLRRDGIEPPGLRDAVGDRVRLVFARSADEVGQDGMAAAAAFVWDFRSRLIPEIIVSMPALQWIHVAAVGVDASLSTDVRQRDVVLTNARGVTAQAMAEYALAMMLYFAKDFGTTVRNQERATWKPRISRNLADACLVLVGTGAVNQRLARISTAIGTRVIGVARHPHTAPPGFERIVGRDLLDVVLSEADYVVIATPLTDETQSMIGAAQLARLKSTAVVINIGRGAVIDESALMDALQGGRIGGAGLDVTWREPLEPNHPLWAMENVLLSPHMSSDAMGWQEAMVERFVDNLDRWLRQQSLVSVVDKELGYVPSDVDTLPGADR